MMPKFQWVGTDYDRPPMDFFAAVEALIPWGDALGVPNDLVPLRKALRSYWSVLGDTGRRELVLSVLARYMGPDAAEQGYGFPEVSAAMTFFKGLSYPTEFPFASPPRTVQEIRDKPHQDIPKGSAWVELNRGIQWTVVDHPVFFHAGPYRDTRCILARKSGNIYHEVIEERYFFQEIRRLDGSWESRFIPLHAGS